MNERFDEERYMEVQLRLRELYNESFNDVSEEELRRREVMNAEFIEGFEDGLDESPSPRQLQDARQVLREHKAALRKYEKAHRTRYPALDAVHADSVWDELLWAFSQLALLHRHNPQYGGLWAVSQALHDDVFDFLCYAYPALVADEMTARIETEIAAVYEAVLRRSDVEKGRWGKLAAAPLTPDERDAQSEEIEKRLLDLDLNLGEQAKRSRVLDALVTSANEIRRYQTPDELADKGESIDREGAYRGPKQAAAENIGKILDDLLGGLPLGIDGQPLGGFAPRGGRTVMGRVAASRKIRLRQFDSLSLVMRSADAHLRNELSGELFEEAMKEVSEVIARKLEERRRINEERES
jgi:hypothetical protein